MVDISKIIDKLKDYLPDTYNKSDGSNISKLIKVLKHELKEADYTRKELKLQKDVDVAEGIYLDRIGANIGQDRGSFNDDQYRILIKSKIQQNLSPGDINNLLDYISAILNITRSEITITNNVDSEPAFFQFEIETQYLIDSGVILEDIYNVLSQLKAAGVKLRGYSRGSFQFAPDLTNIFQFSSVGNESEYDTNRGFSSEENYTETGGKFLAATNNIDSKSGFANINQTTGGFFGSVVG